jgi:hypothetical protein
LLPHPITKSDPKAIATKRPVVLELNVFIF